jgi:hypothetical protein
MAIVPFEARSSEEYFGAVGDVNRQGCISYGDLNLVSDFTGAVLSSLIAGILYNQIAFGRPGNLPEFVALGVVMASVLVPLM